MVIIVYKSDEVRRVATESRKAGGVAFAKR